MRKKLCMFIVIASLLAGCSQRQSNNDTSTEANPTQPQISESVEPDENSADDPIQNPDFDEEDVETDTTVEGWPEGLEEAILDVLMQYEDGTITADGERFQVAPDDFIFPKTRELTCQYSEVMGNYNVGLLSEDKRYEMILSANNFEYVDAENNVTGGNFVVTDVAFWEQ